MKKSQLEKNLDERFAEIGFPNYSDKTIPTAMRVELARVVGLFYGGHVLVVDRRGDALRIYAKAS